MSGFLEDEKLRYVWNIKGATNGQAMPRQMHLYIIWDGPNVFKANRTITAAAIYRLKPRAMARPPVAGMYFHKAIKHSMHANIKEGSTANAAIAAAIGPPKTPLTPIVIMEMATPGVYVIQYLVRFEIAMLSRRTEFISIRIRRGTLVFWKLLGCCLLICCGSAEERFDAGGYKYQHAQ